MNIVLMKKLQKTTMLDGEVDYNSICLGRLCL
jgi:hypothetical protein